MNRSSLNSNSNQAYLDLTRSSPGRPPLAGRTREKAQPSQVSTQHALRSTTVTNLRSLEYRDDCRQSVNRPRAGVLTLQRTTNGPAQSRHAGPPPPESNSRKRARLMAYYKRKITGIEKAKERYSDEVDERLERRPVGVWDKWYDRLAQAEVEEEAAIELARMERVRRSWLDQLIRVQTEQARADRRKQQKSKHKLESIFLD